MKAPHAPAFRLTKWYLDCVDTDGRVAIAYWANVSWHGVTVPWQRSTLYAADREARTYTSLRATPPPVFAGERLAWQASSASCDVEYERTVPPVSLRLLDSSLGRIDWSCEAPAARTRFAVGGSRALHGTGYAERIEITVPPWRMPIDELRWGRWISDDALHSVVWIDWRGDAPNTWVIVDGRVVEVASVRDDGVSAAGAKLTLEPGRTLHQESVGAVVQGIPGLSHLLRGTPLAMRDTKWCTRGTWTTPGKSPTPGWTIHEIVWMR